MQAASKRPYSGRDEPVIPAKKATKDAQDFGRMQVYVRIRPESDRELTDSRHRIVVQSIDEASLVYDPPVEDNLYYYRGKNYKEPGKKEAKNLHFDFDRVFDNESTNIQVYEATTKRFISPFLDGYNVSVFAYGATGSGKTHTMLGSPEDPGIMFFTTMELFRMINSMSGKGQLELSISYFEIYNEQVFDLLTPTHSNSLAVREDANRGVVVSNLSVHTPKDADHLLELLENGNRNRTQHPTDANAESSRSHAIFQVYLKKQEFSSSQEMSIQLSKMSLIDLAGSERASVAYRENRKKSVQREGSNINKSLLALGNCINALASKKKENKKNFHVPYRDSKLTLLLRDSLGGNCYTAMIATVSPSFLSKDDTHNTLVYAQRAKGIALNLTKNTIPIAIQPKNYSRALESLEQKNSDLHEEIVYLKSELNRLKSQLSKQPENPVAVNDDSYRIFQQSQNQLDLLFTEQLNLRRQLMEAESNLRKLDLKLLLRKVENERIKAFGGGTQAREKDTLGSLHDKRRHFSKQKGATETALLENEMALSQLEKEILARMGQNDWLCKTYIANHKLNVENRDRAFAHKHITEQAKILLKRIEANEELVIEQAHLLHKVYQIMSGMNRLSEELEGSFNSILKKVEGKKSVVWRDDQADPVLSNISRYELESMLLLDIHHAIPSTPKASRKSRQLTSILGTPKSFVSNALGETCTNRHIAEQTFRK